MVKLTIPALLKSAYGAKVIKLLIFDLDGTLIDSAPDIIATTNQLMYTRGKPLLPPERIVAAIGEGLKQTVFSLFPETHADPIALRELEKDFFSCYEANLLNDTCIFPGVEQFLLQNKRQVAIVTNKYEVLTHQVLKGLGLDRHNWVRVYGADTLAHKKPDPLPLIEAMKAAGVDRTETVMIGDGIPDMIAARRAGVHSIAIEFGYTQPEILEAQGASFTLASYDHLEAVLAEAEKLPTRPVSPD